MKTKFMIVASLGALFALPSQADPIRAGISIGTGIAIGTINKAKSAPKMTGLIYYESDQVPQNVAKAKEWYLKAIEYKHPVAVYNLGVIYEDENNYKKQNFIIKNLVNGEEKKAVRH